jgi:hypothetical protein
MTIYHSFPAKENYFTMKDETLDELSDLLNK